MSLGENIYKHRTYKGWSQTELADELEVSRQSVSKWENNTATPDLDKLIKMRAIFDITLDELVFGEMPTARKAEEPVMLDRTQSFRILAGQMMLVFGMIFFLLSVFWGDHLYFGEAFGELLSSVIVFISIALLAPYDFKVFSICAIVYFIYSVICFGILNITTITNYVFTFIMSIVILVWFLVCGLHANKKDSEKVT